MHGLTYPAEMFHTTREHPQALAKMTMVPQNGTHGVIPLVPPQSQPPSTTLSTPSIPPPPVDVKQTLKIASEISMAVPFLLFLLSLFILNLGIRYRKDMPLRQVLTANSMVRADTINLSIGPYLLFMARTLYLCRREWVTLRPLE